MLPVATVKPTAELESRWRIYTGADAGNRSHLKPGSPQRDPPVACVEFLALPDQLEASGDATVWSSVTLRPAHTSSIAVRFSSQGSSASNSSRITDQSTPSSS